MIRSNILINALFVSSTLLLSACGSPEDRATSVIEDFCDAYMDRDYGTLKALTTDHQWINQLANKHELFGFDADAITCGIDIKKINDNQFSFIIKNEDFRFLHLAEKINDEFKVTGIKGS